MADLDIGAISAPLPAPTNFKLSYDIISALPNLSDKLAKNAVSYSEVKIRGIDRGPFQFINWSPALFTQLLLQLVTHAACWSLQITEFS